MKFLLRAHDMAIVITYGTFDLFHVGHSRLLQRARSLGSHLVVGVSTDEFNLSKGKRAINSYEERREILLASRYVDDVFAEECWEQKRSDIMRFSAAIFTIGDDWVGKFDNLSDLCAVVYLSRTNGISTTYIRNNVVDIYNGKQRIRDVPTLI